MHARLGRLFLPTMNNYSSRENKNWFLVMLGIKLNNYCVLLFSLLLLVHIHGLLFDAGVSLGITY